MTKVKQAVIEADILRTALNWREDGYREGEGSYALRYFIDKLAAFQFQEVRDAPERKRKGKR